MKIGTKLAVFIASFILLSAIVIAHEPTKPHSMTRILSIPPDSIFYGLGTALDKIRLALTFNNTAKAELGLNIAEDKILEIEQMLLQNKSDVVRKVEFKYKSTLDDVKLSLKGTISANANRELRERIFLEKELEEHESRLEARLNEVSIKLNLVGNLTQEQQDAINSLIDSFLNSTGKVKIVINDGITKVKIKIKIELGKNETEIEREIEEIRNRSGLTGFKKHKAEEQINDAIKSLDELLDKLRSTNVTGRNLTAVTKLLELSQQHLEEAQLAFNQSDFGRAYGLARSAEHLSENAERILHRLFEVFEKRGREVKVETRAVDNQTEVTIRINGFERRFFIDTTDPDAAVEDVARELGVEAQFLRSKVKIMLPEIEKRLEIRGDIKERIRSIIRESISETEK